MQKDAKFWLKYEHEKHKFLEAFINRTRVTVAGVASVSVGLSTGLIEAFSLFERAEIGASSQKAKNTSERAVKPTETVVTQARATEST